MKLRRVWCGNCGKRFSEPRHLEPIPGQSTRNWFLCDNCAHEFAPRFRALSDEDFCKRLTLLEVVQKTGGYKE